ncbi:nucleotidyltransferase family protein [Candidatus Micrarchaeota archaeon]|nr:nucleotidyltransferase family protein [Candidatus Micrarchaeota archaeon]
MTGQARNRDNEVVREICSLMKANPDPDYVRSHLSEKARKKFSLLMQEKRIKQTLDVIKFLNGNHVDYVVLKGVSLSYFEPEREFADLDILLDKEEVEKVANLLIGRYGYEYDRLEELQALRKPGLDNAHDLKLVSKDMLPIEIHFRLFNYLSTGKLPLMTDKIFLKLDGVSIPCPPTEAQLLEVMLHNAYHHLFLCDKERWIRDINILVRNHDIDWDGFIGILAALEQTELVYLTLRYLNGSCKENVAIPPLIMARLRPPSRMSYLKKPVFIFACHFTWDRLFPPKDILWERTNIEPTSRLFFLAYPMNWIRLVFVLTSMLVKR